MQLSAAARCSKACQAGVARPSGVQPWHAFTEVQIGRALELADVIVAHYGLEDILGHEDIAPGRKTDPGPAFPLRSIASRVMGRAHDSLPQYVVTATALNIRKGPDASFDPVAPKLKKGTIVRMLEPGSRWSKVEVVGPTDNEGWVNNDFISQIAAHHIALIASTISSSTCCNSIIASTWRSVSE